MSSRILGKTEEPRTGHEEGNSRRCDLQPLLSFCSSQLRFPERRVRGVAPGLPHTGDPEPGSGAQARERGRREGSGRGGGLGPRGESTEPWEPPIPRGAVSAPPWGPPPGSRGRGPAAAGGSSPRQVPLGHTRPGGCKPQAKVERGCSFSSNPFYTVKTAKPSPRRPLLIGRQTDEKPKQTCELTFFLGVFPSQ